MEKHSLKIGGMGGEHCVMVIKKILANTAGVTAAHVELGKADIETDETKASKEAVVNAIEKMGYKIEQ